MDAAAGVTSAPSPTVLTRGLWLLAGLTGLGQAWASRNRMNPDGVSYLDIGNALARGEWGSAVNAYWSPLYPACLAALLKLAAPSAYWEFPLVHLVNAVIWVGAIASLELFLGSLIAWQRSNPTGMPAAPAWMYRAWAYAAFIPAGLGMVTLGLVGADLLVLTSVLLVAALLCRFAAGDRRWMTFGAFGAVLGAGYLAKAVMFPVGLVALLLAAAIVRGTARGRAGVLVALVVFAALAGPFIAALSVTKGRPTVGDSGRLHFAWSLGGEPGRLAVVAMAGRQHLAHPPRRVLDTPPVYEFGAPVGGTLPLWYDPSYWSEGAQIPLRLRRLVRVAVSSLLRGTAFARDFVPSLVALAVLCGITADRSALLARLRRLWFLFALAVVPMAAYVLVPVLPRYVAGFFVVLLTAAAGVALGAREAAGRLGAVLVVTLVAFQAGPVVAAVAHDIAREARRIARDDPAIHPDLAAADGLHRLGVMAGDRVAVVGDDFFRAGWARLARVRITAVVDADPLHLARADNGATRALVAEHLARAGVKAVVAYRAPSPPVATAGWTTLGSSGWYAGLVDPRP